MKLKLYDKFENWYREGGAIYIISDTHFGEIDLYKSVCPTAFDFEGCDVRPTDESIVERLDELKVKSINSVCGKKDTLIILGDVGNVEWVKKLRAGYKVLVMGNHDVGASNYKRVVKENVIIDAKDAIKMYSVDNTHYKLKVDLPDVYNVRQNIVNDSQKDNCTITFTGTYDNKLFDEVYEGPLFINNKVLLSHEKIELPYAFNIHGHEHAFEELKTILKYYDADMSHDEFVENYFETIKTEGWTTLNLCAEYFNNKPICLNYIVESGILGTVKRDIHRVTIDNAIERKKPKIKCFNKYSK